MESQVVFQISLVAAFIAGMVALFAPCCISYLFPAYLGSVFKERRQVLFMTFIFSLGIFSIMMPIVLGFKALQSIFFNLHDQTYIIGGLFMIFVAFISLIGVKLPMPRFAYTRNGQKNDIVSTFSLGVFSGIASACCAPVLIGVLTLSSLSPTLFQSLGVGFAYVLGMVTPLYLASLFLYKGKLLQKPVLKKKISEIKIRKEIYPIFLSNIVAFVIFFLTGVLMITLTFTGDLGMSTSDTASIKMINQISFRVTDFTNNIPGINIIFTIVVVILIYKFIQLMRGKNNKSKDLKNVSMVYTCPMDPEVKEKKPGTCPKCGMKLEKMNEK